MTIHAFTSCSFSYLNRARVLAESLKKNHPDWKVWILMTDKIPAGFEFDIEIEDFDEVLWTDELFGDITNHWLFKHDIVEACTAVKGKAASFLLTQPGCSGVMYFDPDTAVFNTMNEAVELLNDYSILLTPHQITPEPATDLIAQRDNEITSLGYGVYNLGYVGIANDEEGRAFAKWWEERLFNWCWDRTDIGVFVDQKWCDLVPCFFDRVKILRDPGYNCASWNLSHRELSFDSNGQAFMNDKPLRFFHFTKLGAVGDVMTQRYAKGNTEIYELWYWYKQQVVKHSTSAIPKGWWYYGHFDNGVKIDKSVREFFRDRVDLQRAFADPFKTDGNSLYKWLLAHEPKLLEEQQGRGFSPV